MSKLGPISLVVLGVAAIAVMAAAEPALATETAPEEAPAAEGAPAPDPTVGLDCHSEALTGSGDSFLSSQEQSETVAIKDWLEKSVAIYGDANWEKTKDSNLTCVKQGLYSKCFATATPCGSKPPATTASPKSGN